MDVGQRCVLMTRLDKIFEPSHQSSSFQATTQSDSFWSMQREIYYLGLSVLKTRRYLSKL